MLTAPFVLWTKLIMAYKYATKKALSRLSMRMWHQVSRILVMADTDEDSLSFLNESLHMCDFVQQWLKSLQKVHYGDYNFKTGYAAETTELGIHSRPPSRILTGPYAEWDIISRSYKAGDAETFLPLLGLIRNLISFES